MKRIAASLIATTLALTAAPLLLPTPAHAETLRMKVKQEQHYNMPKRGMTMAEVRHEYGAPLKVLATRGGSSKYQPPIHRWEYAKYIVYFEYSHVIHSVLRTPGPHAL
ncbi:MAG: hypothetical protein EPN36_11115 [Rhodanobacteraceae bacterium]|nr:MAG: hypothetical protein EPN36_11115 [Rhodanobacteraceae bacterium]